MEVKTITLANLAESTEQEVFDYITSNLLKQNAKSLDDSKSCSYRGSEGRKCAAGFVIADEEYDIDIEGRNWSVLVIWGRVPKRHSPLISALQVIHDSFSCSEWDIKFQSIAERYNLKYPNKK